MTGNRGFFENSWFVGLERSSHDATSPGPGMTQGHLALDGANHCFNLNYRVHVSYKTYYPQKRPKCQIQSGTAQKRGNQTLLPFPVWRPKMKRLGFPIDFRDKTCKTIASNTFGTRNAVIIPWPSDQKTSGSSCECCPVEGAVPKYSYRATYNRCLARLVQNAVSKSWFRCV